MIFKRKKFIKEEERLSNIFIASREQQEIVQTYRLIVMALFVCWFVPMINRIQNYADPDNPVFWLFCMHGALQPLQGLFNILIYLSPSLQKMCCGSAKIKYEKINDEKYGNFMKLYAEDYD